MTASEKEELQNQNSFARVADGNSVVERTDRKGWEEEGI